MKKTLIFLEISESDARSKVAELVVGGKYLQDVWG